MTNPTSNEFSNKSLTKQFNGPLAHYAEGELLRIKFTDPETADLCGVEMGAVALVEIGKSFAGLAREHKSYASVDDYTTGIKITEVMKYTFSGILWRSVGRPAKAVLGL